MNVLEGSGAEPLFYRIISGQLLKRDRSINTK